MGTIALIVLLILAAMVLILFELLTPTFGPLAAMALAALVGAVWLAFTISPLTGLVLIAALLFGMPTYVVLLVRLLPRSAMGRRLFLGKTPRATADAAPEAPAVQALVGRTAVAETMLRPAGAIRVDGKRINAQAESGVIDKGQTVRIVAISMGNAVVRKVEQ